MNRTSDAANGTSQNLSHPQSVGSEASTRIAELEAALSRQCDNMAFVLNRANVLGWRVKFEKELAEDRAALPKPPLTGGA